MCVCVCVWWRERREGWGRGEGGRAISADSHVLHVNLSVSQTVPVFFWIELDVETVGVGRLPLHQLQWPCPESPYQILH